MHTGKELEARKVQKGRLSCDSDVLQVGSARCDSTWVVKVNRKTNRRKTRPYCNYICSYCHRAEKLIVIHLFWTFGVRMCMLNMRWAVDATFF